MVEEKRGRGALEKGRIKILKLRRKGRLEPRLKNK